MLTKLKKKIQKLLSSEAKLAYKLGLTPNAVSVLGIILSILSALAYALGLLQPLWLLGAVFLLLASGFCDALDGIIARNYQLTTAFGGFFDSLLDRYSDGIIYAGIIVGALCDVAWGLTALVGSMLVSYSRARAESAGIKMESIGLAERAERVLILAVATIVAFFWLPALNYGIVLLAIISNLTVLQRGFYVYKWLKKKESTPEKLVSSSAA